MHGPEPGSAAGPEMEGLTSRVFRLLMDQMEAATSVGERRFSCTCSFVEIYNETIIDLLEPSTGKQPTLREDAKRGVVLQDCSEQELGSLDDALQLLHLGNTNRHVGCTAMNSESSRSHSIFTVYVSSILSVNGVEHTTSSKFNLVDLAGSERQKTSMAAGDRLKEASSINKSLSTLGKVINTLVDGHGHVHYRDSKLTFLLKDSLGGNARTSIIANVSPSGINLSETQSTLSFVQRAKFIKNSAVLNKVVVGDVAALQLEVKRLEAKLLAAEAGRPDIAPPVSVDIATMSAFLTTLKDHSKLKRQLDDLTEQCAAKDKALQQTRLVVKLRDSHIERLRQGQPSEPSDELAAARAELEAVRTVSVAEARTAMAQAAKRKAKVQAWKQRLGGGLLDAQRFELWWGEQQLAKRMLEAYAVVAEGAEEMSNTRRELEHQAELAAQRQAQLEETEQVHQPTRIHAHLRVRLHLC
jgi:kinesin family protein 15